MSDKRRGPCPYCPREMYLKSIPRHVRRQHPDVQAEQPTESEDGAPGPPVDGLFSESADSSSSMNIPAGPLPVRMPPGNEVFGDTVLTIPFSGGTPDTGSENGEGPATEPVEEPALPSCPGRSEPRAEGPLVILVTSGKGGVGKSTVSLGLAQGLHQATGAEVGVMDADIDNPCLQVLGGAQVPDLLETALAPREVNGVRVYSPGAAMSPGTPFMREEDDRMVMLASMLVNIDWSDCRYLIIDTPPGASAEVRGLVAAKPPDGAIIVTQPSRVSFEAIRRTHSMLTMLQVNILGVVENMSGGALGQGAGDLAHDILGVPLLGRIGLSEEVARRGDLGEPMPLEPFAGLVREVLEWELTPEEVGAIDSS